MRNSLVFISVLALQLICATATSGDFITSLSLNDFKDVLFTEIHNEIEIIKQNVQGPSGANQRIRRRQTQDSSNAENDLWDHVVKHGWTLVDEATDGENDNRYGRSLIEEHTTFPFLLCSHSRRINTGYERLLNIEQKTGVKVEDIVPIYNDDAKSCFHISLNPEKARYLETATFKRVRFTIVPFNDLMKMPINSLDEVTQDYWPIAAPTQGQEEENDWQRSIHVAIVPSPDIDINSKAAIILQDIQNMAQEGSRQRRRRMEEGSETEKADTSLLSVTDAFSLTSTIHEQSSGRRLKALGASRAESLSESIANGIEADHNCKSMFDSLDTVIHDHGKDFEIILNPSNKASHYDDSSASNTDCIVSFMIALSTHPSVLTVEPDTPITPHDYQSQWISQSYEKSRPESKENRPFFEVGLTGKGQVISMSDSGLDVNNKYFGPPTSNKLYTVSHSHTSITTYYEYNHIEYIYLQLTNEFTSCLSTLYA